MAETGSHPAPSATHKRKLCESEEGAESEAMEEEEDQNKRHCSSPGEQSSSPAASYDLNFPLPGDHGLPCIVKVTICACAVCVV